MTKLTVADVRAKFPEYPDLTDDQLLEGVRRKFYNDIPREKFFADFGLKAAPSPSQDRAPPARPARQNAQPIDIADYELPDQPQAEADIATAMGATDPRFSRFSKPESYTDPATDVLRSTLAPATSSRDLTGSRAPSDPFEGEGFGALATRRGQQFAQGATDVVAALPEAMAITGEMADRSRAEGAGETLDMRAQMIADIEEALQNPNLPPETRAIIERNLADLTEGQGVITGMRDAPITPAQDRPIYGAGDRIRTAVEGTVGAPDPRDQGFWSQVATGAGNMTGMIGAAAAGTMVGGPVAGATVGAMSGASMNQAQVFEEALQSGADQETALQAAKWATVIGASEIVPITRALKLLPPRLRGELTTGMMRKFVDIAQASGEEAAQEYLATVANNIVAQQLYDPDRGWTEGAGEAALVGAVLGAGVGTAGVMLEGRGDAAPPATVPPRPPAQPQTPEEELAAALGAPAPQAAPATPSAPAQPAQPQAEAQIAAAMGAEPVTQEPPAKPNLAPGSQAVVNDAANPAIGIDTPGPFNGATVTIDQDQADVPGGMRRVILPDGRKTVIGEALLVPPAATRTAPAQQPAPPAPAAAAAPAPAVPAPATPDADLAAAMGAPAPVSQQAQQPPQPMPPQAPQQAAPPAPPQALGNPIAEPSRVPVGARVAVSIGGQQPFTAEIIEQTRQGPRIREADGSVSVVPLDEIEDGAITFTEPVDQPAQPQAEAAPAAPQALPEAEIAAAMGAEGGAQAAPEAEIAAAMGAEPAAQPAPVPAAQPAAPAPTRMESARTIRTDTARTPAGTEIDVEYAIVDLDDLTASNLPDGRINPAYPQERQPRDRTKGQSEQQIQRIMRDFDPRQLDAAPTTDTGAMIVDEAGIVESGNGRTMTLQRIYQERPDLARAYVAHLEAQGYPVEDMAKPVLVRIRRTEMTPEEIEGYTRESNTDTKLAMSATEQAMSDAAALPDAALDLYRGGDIDTAGNRDFVRAFIQSVVTENEQGKMIAPDGSMSQDAVRRVQAALLAKAYGDSALVAKLVESADSNIKSIGGALLDVSASWAKMRSAARAGTIAPEMDQTEALIEAVRLVDRARTEKRNVIEYVKQPDLLSGDGISPMGQRFLALMFRDTRQWTKPAGRDRIVSALRFYGDEAMKTTPGADMLGGTANPSATLDLAKERQDGEERRAERQQPNLFAPQPAGSDGEGVRAPARDGDGPGTEGPVEGVGEERPAGQPEGVTRTANQAVPRPSERSTGTPDASAADMPPSSQRGDADDSDNTDSEQSTAIPAPGEARARRRERATKRQMAEEASFATQEIVRLMPRLRAELDRLDLKKVKLFLDEGDPDWQGMFQVTGDGDFEVIIGAALDPMKTLHHEVIHIMRQMNLFTPQEWRALELAAERWLAKHDIEERYPHLTHEERLEEAIAEEFSWALEKLRPPKGGVLVRAFNKIHRLLKAIRNVFRGAGFNTPEDIFGRILSGEISKRQAWNTGYYARMGYNLQAALAPSAGEVEALAKRIKADLDLRDLSMFLSRGDLKVNMIAVDRAEQGRGKGSEAMRRIVAFADARGLRITLSPGQRDDGFGTTSRSRLVDFYKRFGFKENKGRAKDFAISEGMYRDPAPLVRLQAAIKSGDPDDTFAAQFMVELAQVDDLFLNPTSTATTLEGVFADIDPSVKMEGRLAADDPRVEGKDIDSATMFVTAKDKAFYIYETAREVWIDVSELGTGDGGNRIYSAIGDYAFNTGKVFIGDPEGLSASALRRRTDNMLSSALKHGTTRHLEPHKYQRDGDARLGVPALRWTEGDDLGNLQSLIDVSVASLIQNIPEVVDARYDFQTGTFRSSEGQPLTDGTLDKWASAARGSGKARVGRRSLKRGILLNTLARAESGQRPGLLERSLRQQRQLVTQGGISRTFYQARTSGQPKPKPDPDQQEQQGAVQIEGKTAAERIAAANAAFGPPAGWVQPPLPMTWTLPTRTGLMRVREGFQDKFIYLRAAQAQIEEATGQRLPDDMNAGLKETLFQPRVAERLDRLFKGEVQRVFDALAEAKKRFGVTREDLWVYMVAKHAPERNAVMAKRDPERFAKGNGSGLYDEAAAALLADLDAQGKTPHLEKLAAMLRKMLDDDLEHRRMNGLLSDEQFKSYKEMYQNYVPLRGFAERDDGDQIGRLGRGFDMRGKEVRTALGRTSIADDPISQIIVMRQEGIIRAEKNRVGRAMLKLVQKYPAPGLWEVIGKLPTRNVLDAETGQVRKMVDFGAVDQNHTLAVKVGGEVQYLRIEDPLLLAAFNNLSGDSSAFEKYLKLGRMLLTTSSRAVRIVSSTSTGLNPNFTIPNAQSDFIEGVWTAYNVDKKGMAAAYAKAYMPSFIEAIRDEFGDAFDVVRQRVMKRQKISDDEYREMKAFVEEWKLSGGRSSFYGFRDIEEISDDISREIRRHGRASWREASFGEKIETAKDLSGAPFRGLITVLDKINQPVESAGRLAMYVAARKMGLSKEQAAALSLDATSNYYRKGHYTPALRALYAFINPAIQSLEKQGRFSVQKSLRKAGRVTLNWKNWAYVFGPVTVLGFLQTVLAVELFDDEDDDPEGVPLFERISEFDRHRNLMIPTGIEYDEVNDPTQLDAQGNPVKKRVPRLTTINWRMAYPLRPFLALGSELALSMYGRRSGSDVVKNVGKSMLMSWNPMADNQPENMLAPTILDPLIDMRLNRNFMDSPITPEDRYGNAEGLPDSSQFYERSNSAAAIELAQFLNRATGGTKFEAGWVDIYPGQLDYMYRFFTGGVGTFVEQLGGVVADAASDVETETRNIPVLRSFATRTGGMAESEFYYDAKAEVTEQKNRLRAAYKALEVDPNDEQAKEVFDHLAKELNASVGEDGKFVWKNSLSKPFEEADEQLKTLREELTATITSDMDRKTKTETAAHLRLEIEQVQRKAREQYVEMRTRNLSLAPEAD